MALLELRDISKRFGGLQALARVSLEVEDGVIASLIGPNGAGKTTLFNTLTGLYQPDDGQIRFQDRSLMGMKPDKITSAGISRTFQNIRLFSHMTVLDNVLVGMHSRVHTGLPEILLRTREFHKREKEALHRAMELIELTGLTGREGEWAHQLSYGEQRRLELARALAAAPKLLLLDEPTAGMNFTEAQSLVALLRELMGRYVQAILLIEHNMRVVMGVSHRVHVLDYGEKIAEGDPDEIRRDPRVIEAYLGSGAWAKHAQS
ncbi:MAG: ATP-binding cassette domain-containing protein [Deltaproteobacteria bacterium]|nr:ATP-binding cassette domain-containing protein [Deltaproteobacteria bacterium]